DHDVRGATREDRRVSRRPEDRRDLGRGALEEVVPARGGESPDAEASKERDDRHDDEELEEGEPASARPPPDRASALIDRARCQDFQEQMSSPSPFWFTPSGPRDQIWNEEGAACPSPVGDFAASTSNLVPSAVRYVSF